MILLLEKLIHVEVLFSHTCTEIKLRQALVVDGPECCPFLASEVSSFVLFLSDCIKISLNVFYDPFKNISLISNR